MVIYVPILCTSFATETSKAGIHGPPGIGPCFVRYECPATQTPTQKLEIGFSMFSSQEIGPSLVSFQMIFEALQSELFRFKFHSLGSKILKIPEFNLVMPYLLEHFLIHHAQGSTMMVGEPTTWSI